MSKFNTEEFLKLQAHWYEKLAQTDFKDAEDVGVAGFEDGRPLKRWTGAYSIHSNLIASTLPEPKFVREERLFHHRDFQEICISVTRHGNHSFTPDLTSAIWGLHIEGHPMRNIAQGLGVRLTAVFRIIKKLEVYSDLMSDDEPESSITPAASLIVRPYLASMDAPLLFSSWRNSLWFDEKRDERQSDAFFRKATQAIKKLIQSPDCKIRVGCLKDSQDIIIGYAVCHGSNLTWIYVKADYRKKGIGTFLAGQFSTVSIPMTKIGKSIVKNHDLKTTEPL